MGDYNKKDASKDTNSSNKEVAKSWHQAREDAQKSDNTYDKNLTKDWKRKLDKDRN